MAGPIGTGFVRDGKSVTRHADWCHHVHDNYVAYGAVRFVLNQPDIHDEFHHAVCIIRSTQESSLLTVTRMLIVLAFASLVSWIVRYRFLNMYARLPPEPQRKEPQIDLFPDTQDGDSKPGLANYLDEFLSAIKVFGYRE